LLLNLTSEGLLRKFVRQLPEYKRHMMLLCLWTIGYHPNLAK
jgi:hypothetical protein